MRWCNTSRFLLLCIACATMEFRFGFLTQRAMALPPDTSPKQIDISAVTSPHESVVIDLFVQGCYNGVGIREHYRFHYTATPRPAISVRALELPFLSNAKKRRAQLGELGTVTLTPHEAVRLDNLLHFYRRSHKPSFLFTNTITVALFDGNKKRILEQFRNTPSSAGICADADAQDLQRLGIADKPTLSLARVITRAAEAHRKHLTSILYATPDRKSSQAYIRLQWKIQEQESEAKVRKIVEVLPGYDAMQSTFTLSKVNRETGPPHDGSFFLHMDSKTPRLIDGADWYDPQKHDHVLYDWNQFLDIWHTVDRVVARHTWISEWKKLGHGRSITARIGGLTPNTQDADEFQSTIRAWHRAGLRGMPRYELWFDSENRKDLLTVIFGDEDTRALLPYVTVSPDKTGKRYWFDTFHTPEDWTPEKDSLYYAVISPDGKWHSPTAGARQR